MAVFFTIILLLFGMFLFSILSRPKSDEEREYEDECQIEYLSSLNWKSGGKRWHRRKTKPGRSGGK